jgi:hypothetical protein
MPDPAPNPELLRSLGRLVRGLSLLFWGLPVALVVCVQSAQTEYLRLFGIFPPLVSTAVLVYGLTLMGRFRPEETVWMAALERARMLAVVNLGLSPFLFWWNRMPSRVFYIVMAQLMAAAGLLFLLALNPVLRRLTAMLPDETLRHDTLIFTRLNAALLGFDLAAVAGYCVVFHLKWSLPELGRWQGMVERGSQWTLWLFLLLAMAMTMALLWKIKEVIFHSVFGGER